VRRQPSRIRSQQGLTLLVGLIMLILVTVLVLASFTLGKNNLFIVGNMQHRAEAAASAQRAIEEAISTRRLTESPGNIFTPGCGDVPNTRCYDVTGDGADDVRVTLTPTPTCIKAESIKNANLNIGIADDQLCVVSVDPTKLGTTGAESGDSLCSYALYEVRAVAEDATAGTTNARVASTQGIGVRVRTADILSTCP